MASFFLIEEVRTHRVLKVRNTVRFNTKMLVVERFFLIVCVSGFDGDVHPIVY